MHSPDNTVHYRPTAKLLHWLVAGMVVLQFILAKLADLAAGADSAVRELALLANHKSVGITILALVIVRLAWRQKNPPPALPATMPKWQVTASRASHWSLYLLLFAMPLSGWLMSSASAYSVSWFNLFQLPDFVAPNPELKSIFKETHELIGKLLVVVAAIHIIAAVKHAVIDKDGVLRRMVSAISIAAFFVVIGPGTIWLGGAGNSDMDSPATTPDTVRSDTNSIVETPVAGSDLPLWRIDYATSYVKFVGDQAGAEFAGEWESWTAEIRFSPEQFAAGTFDVTVQATSVETQDDDRDATLADPEWFDSANFPEVYFRANNFSESMAGGYIAHGQLVIKGVAAPVALRFTVEESGNSRVLAGTTNLDRLALGVGTGEWEDTDWVGKDVSVQVRVAATIGE